MIGKRCKASGLILATIASLIVSPAAQAQPWGQNRLAILDSGKRFVEIIGTPDSDVALPSAQDMRLRFANNSVLYDPADAIVVDDPALNEYKQQIREILTRLLAVYDRGPKPDVTSIHFKIDYASDINCMAVPVAPEQYANVMTQVSDTVFDPDIYLLSKPARNVKVDRSAIRKADKVRNQAETTSQPSQIEIRCTAEAMKQLGDSHEIGFILAHELSHILLGHWERNEAKIRKQKRLDSMLVDGASFIVATGSDYKIVNGEIKAVPRSAEIQAHMEKLTMTTFLINEYNLVIQGPAWERKQEREADLLALDLMQASGLHADEGYRVMDKFAIAEKKLKISDGFVDRIFGSVSADALLQLQRSDFELLDWLKKTSKRVGMAIFSFWRAQSINRTHDNFDARSEYIVKYLNTHEDIRARDPAAAATKSAWLKGDKFAGKPIGDVLQPMDDAMAIMKTLSGSGCQGLTEAQKAHIASLTPPAVAPKAAAKGKGKGKGKTPPAAQTPPMKLSQIENYMLSSWSKLCNNDLASAVAYAEKAAHGAERQPTFYTAYVGLLSERKMFPQVLTTINEAETQAPPYSQYILPKVEATYQLGRKEEATKLAVVCRDYNISNEPLARQCMAMVGLDLEGNPIVNSDDPKKPDTGSNALFPNLNLLNNLRSAVGS